MAKTNAHIQMLSDTAAEPPDRFSVCIPLTLAQEAPVPLDWGNQRNFSDDAHDPGGKTQCGITQGEYDLWRKAHGLPQRAVRLLGRPEGYAIYRINYWMPHCPG